MRPHAGAVTVTVDLHSGLDLNQSAVLESISSTILTE